MAKIKIIFFDLDNTLFDHTRAERAALKSVIQTHTEVFAGVGQEDFLRTYDQNNRILWKKMARGEISAKALKLQRFAVSLEQLGCRGDHAEALSQTYLRFYLKQGFTFPNVVATLNYLKPKYALGILSNGFPEIQRRKLQNAGLGPFFKYKLYSDDLGVMKPALEIFERAAKIAGVRSSEAAYVGDSYEDDVRSSKKAGWTAVHFRPSGEFERDGYADFQVTDLLELRKIF